jgi:integrase/recombinase XerD
MRLLIIVNAELAKAVKKLSMKRITSHVFRHAFGFHMLRAGCDIRHIQAFLGHESLSSTEVYTKVEKEDLKRVIDTYHPRRWRKADG